MESLRSGVLTGQNRRTYTQSLFTGTRRDAVPSGSDIKFGTCSTGSDLQVCVMADIILGCVGKPSVGKSTFFNAVTDGKVSASPRTTSSVLRPQKGLPAQMQAKVGNYPFTTIEVGRKQPHYPDRT